MICGTAVQQDENITFWDTYCIRPGVNLARHLNTIVLEFY